jgi:hypothetical protein
MVCFLFLPSQYVLTIIQQRGEVVGYIGLIIDTHYVGPIQYTPTFDRSDLLNYLLITFIRENKADLRSKTNF